ncbi:MAG: hypothetical protein LBS53_10150 [Synergistaceae bacterium]|jgi:hypothetical protein|nr:hypothetical protein [Synergistaceae bacterium]
MYMYIPGIITGFLFTSLFWLAVIGWLGLRHNDVLWEERNRAVSRERAYREDHRDNRRSEKCVETAEALREAV